jgi:hypothetical protein
MSVNRLKQFCSSFAGSYLFFCITWLLTRIFDPYVDPTSTGVPLSVAIQDSIRHSFYSSIVIASIYFLVIFLVLTWWFSKVRQYYCFSIFLGIYIGVLLEPSFRSQIISEWYESHLPSLLASIGDLLLVFGVPLLISYLIVVFEKRRTPKEDIGVRSTH